MTPPILVTLVYGNQKSRDAYRPLFEKWRDRHHGLGLTSRIVVVTDKRSDTPPFDPGLPGITVFAADVSGYSEVLRPDQPFDVKGALMCEWLLHANRSFLMLDNDAFLQREGDLDHPDLDPGILIGMPRDLGALHSTYGMTLHAPFEHVFKRCAGVAWFGDVCHDRRRALVADYKACWQTLARGGVDGGVPWEPHLSRLLEQNAWSYAAQRAGQPVLPDSWNWPGHLKAYRRDVVGKAAAHVCHHFGHTKWKRLGPIPLNV